MLLVVRFQSEGHSADTTHVRLVIVVLVHSQMFLETTRVAAGAVTVRALVGLIACVYPGVQL